MRNPCYDCIYQIGEGSFARCAKNMNAVGEYGFASLSRVYGPCYARGSQFKSKSLLDPRDNLNLWHRLVRRFWGL